LSFFETYSNKEICCEIKNNSNSPVAMTIMSNIDRSYFIEHNFLPYKLTSSNIDFFEKIICFAFELKSCLIEQHLSF